MTSIYLPCIIYSYLPTYLPTYLPAYLPNLLIYAGWNLEFQPPQGIWPTSHCRAKVQLWGPLSQGQNRAFLRREALQEVPFLARAPAMGIKWGFHLHRLKNKSPHIRHAMDYTKWSWKRAIRWVNLHKNRMFTGTQQSPKQPSPMNNLTLPSRTTATCSQSAAPKSKASKHWNMI